MAYTGFLRTFFGALEDFSNRNRCQYGEESVLCCRACLELPDDPILTSCLHLYCTECFTELLVNARGPNGRCSGVVACKADQCRGFEIAHGYRQLTDSQFEQFAESIGITVSAEPTTLFGELPSAGFDDSTAYGGGVANQPDDVAALWRSIDPNFDRPPARYTRTPFADMVIAADRAVEENEDVDEWEDSNGGVRYGWNSLAGLEVGDRSEGYRTEDADADEEDEDEDDENKESGEYYEAVEHSFVAKDDAHIERGGRYILDSDSDIRGNDLSSDESDSDGSDASDVSETEARLLKKDWPDDWRRDSRGPPPKLSQNRQEQLHRGGWSCHGLW